MFLASGSIIKMDLFSSRLYLWSANKVRLADAPRPTKMKSYCLVEVMDCGSAMGIKQPNY